MRVQATRNYKRPAFGKISHIWILLGALAIQRIKGYLPIRVVSIY